MMRGAWILLSLLLLPPLLEAAFITDTIRVGLYSEPTSNPNIQPLKILLSGEEIKVLEKKGDFVRVQLGDGAKGWIGRRYVVDNTPAVRSLVDSRKEVERLKVELDQTRQELFSLQQELAGGGADGVLKDALAAANKEVKTLQEKLKQKAKPAADDPAAVCEQQLESMEAKQLQCQVRLAKYTKDDKDSLTAENEKLRETMQQAVNLLAMPPSGEVPVLIPASAFTATRTTIVQPPVASTPPQKTPAATPIEQQGEDEGLPVWVYLMMGLTLITGVIGGFALFDYRSRYRYSIRL